MHRVAFAKADGHLLPDECRNQIVSILEVPRIGERIELTDNDTNETRISGRIVDILRMYRDFTDAVTEEAKEELVIITLENDPVSE